MLRQSIHYEWVRGVFPSHPLYCRILRKRLVSAGIAYVVPYIRKNLLRRWRLMLVCLLLILSSWLLLTERMSKSRISSLIVLKKNTAFAIVLLPLACGPVSIVKWSMRIEQCLIGPNWQISISCIVISPSRGSCFAETILTFLIFECKRYNSAGTTHCCLTLRIANVCWRQ